MTPVLEPGLQLLERQAVRGIAIYRVGGAEDEGRVWHGGVRRVEQVQGAAGVDAEVGLGLSRFLPIVGRFPDAKTLTITAAYGG